MTTSQPNGTTLRDRAVAVAHNYALIIAVLVVTAVTIRLILDTSLVVDGTRYFWLDDDQMVSMRYARSLASGEGLVWNPGEHVEGYTSLGWTLVMAAVHLLPLSDATTSLAMKVISWALACAVLVLTDRLLRIFVKSPGLTRPAVLLTLALSAELLYWSVNAFETTLLTALFLAALVRMLDDRERDHARIVTYLLVGLLPVARSDAYHLWAALIVIAVALSRNRRRLAECASVAVMIPILQLAFRRVYYGEWLPNTYYLKVAGYDGRFWSGAGYLKGFLESYSVPILLVAAAVMYTRDRRIRWIAVAMVATVANVLTVGADNFPHYRFFAPWVPVLLALGAASAWQLAESAVQARTVLIAALVIVTTTQAGVNGRTALGLLRSVNGTPEHGLIAALMIRDYTRPEASVAVTAAGSVPYFSRRRAIDLLGKTDAHVAHLPPHARGGIGHRKFDMEYSLSLRPDVVVTFLTDRFGADPESAAYIRSAAGQDDYRVALRNSPQFASDYLGQPVPVPYLLETGLIYVRRDSPERQTLDRWREPAFRR